MFGLFQKKVEVTIPDGAGGTKTVKIPQKEFDQWVRDGKITKMRTCKVYILDPMKGCYTASWSIGDGGNVSVETYERFKDRDGDLYALAVYREGVPENHITTRDFWVEYRAAEEALLAGDSGPMDKLTANIKRG